MASHWLLPHGLVPTGSGVMRSAVNVIRVRKRHGLLPHLNAKLSKGKKETLGGMLFCGCCSIKVVLCTSSPIMSPLKKEGGGTLPYFQSTENL